MTEREKMLNDLVEILTKLGEDFIVMGENDRKDNGKWPGEEGAIKVAKFLAEVTLLAQPFVKGDGKETVGQLVKAQGATVNDFALFVVGEGIEKKKDDFAAEVAAMTKA